MSHTSQHRVRFGDCDLAGIAFYPRLLALVDAAVEDWTEATLGLDRTGLLVAHGLGLPMADLQIGFAQPCRLGETLAITVAAARLGTSSLALAVTGAAAGAPRFSATLVQVLIRSDTGKAMPWPDDWRERIAATMGADDERMAS